MIPNLGFLTWGSRPEVPDPRGPGRTTCRHNMSAVIDPQNMQFFIRMSNQA